MTYREQILSYAITYHGEYGQIKKAIETNEPYQKAVCKYPYVTILDEDYPIALRRLQYPPFILFYQGDLSLSNKEAVAIVGSRKASPYGILMSKHVVTLLRDKYVIVSGLAMGIDGMAHQVSLHHHTIAVIGCGIDCYYPKCNQSLQETIAKEHLILSEYPPGTLPLAHHFPWRNRILAGLSKAIVVIEATHRSGTMITVNEGLELSLPIYCVPANFNSLNGKGSNYLIAQGAQILVDDEDIVAI